jgi:predicted metal-dependent hydrolase
MQPQRATFCRRYSTAVSLSVRFLLLSTVVFVSSNVVRAVSVSEYQQSLKRAITALDTLMLSDEDETEAEFNARFDETLSAVRNTLPETVTVNCGEEFCTVDNSWLHEELKDVEKAIDSDWYVLLRHVIEKLKAIEERVAELQNPALSATSKASEKQKLSEILNRPEYQTKNRAKSALARLADRFLRWISKLFARRMPTQSGSASSVGLWVQILVVALALAVLAYVARLVVPRFWQPRVRKRKEKAEPRIVLGEHLEPEQSAVDLLSEAETLARSGQVRAAIRKAYIALLVELGDRKLLSLSQHKTNRDYLRSLRPIPSLYPLMSGLTDSFERHWYGFVPATPDDWQNFREGYRETLRTKN